MTRPSTPPPASTLVILAGDILATRAGELLELLAFGSWEPAVKLRDALGVYSEVRLGTAMSEQADFVLEHCKRIDEPAPVTQRSGAP
jgi:hypothetical protein